MKLFQAFRGCPGTLFYWSMIMKITVNGEPHDHRGTGSVHALLNELGAIKAHTALMINGEVVPSTDWESPV